MIKSFSFDEQEIIKNILKLHCSHSIELDPTYSVGAFYRYDIQKPKYKFDLYPCRADVLKANAERLPIKTGVINTIMFDPPFLATKGPSLRTEDKNNIIVKRFGAYPTEKKLFAFYRNALKELYRVMADKGTLIFKCQDKISGSKQYLSHVYIVNEAEKLGFYCKDLFVLLAKNRLVPKWQLVNQQHARKFHCYYLVFNKVKKSVTYT